MTAPSDDFAPALVRFAALAALDGPDVIPEGRSLFLHHGERTQSAVVLLHGLTNAPQQWLPFASGMHLAGWSVVVPRLPGHGYADRSGRMLADVRASSFVQVANDAVDIALAAAPRVVVAGLSIGGGIAARLALERTGLAHAVIIVPLFGMRRLGATPNAALAAVLRAAPNFFVAWDPKQVPPYGYLRFASRALGETLAIGVSALHDARSARSHARVSLLLNAKEPAVNNALAQTFARRLDLHAGPPTTTTVLRDLPANHDIIDPTNPHARTPLVYPTLRTLLES